jgi:UDP-N-acetylglucosamine 1-carboxyvinyltransferase
LRHYAPKVLSSQIKCDILTGMSQLKIQGGKKLQGTLPVYGSKNAALPLLAASLLTKETVKLTNIPLILDVTNMLRIMAAMGVDVAHEGTTVSLTSADVAPEKMPEDLVGQLRGSILLMGALLGRGKHVSLPLPGGDIIGARPIDVHLDAFEQLGARITQERHAVIIDGADMAAGTVTLREASVTATENIMMVAATLPGTTTIHIAAQEPHIVALGMLLRHMGAQVAGAGTHTITITGTAALGGAEMANIPDMLEAGLFILLAATTKSKLTIENVPLDYLQLFCKKLEDIGIAWTEAGRSVTVDPGPLSAFRVQTLPYPGIATDLQAPFSVVATQAIGTSLIHDPMYESRFRHCDELMKMGASITVCDPHRVLIAGPTPLHGRHIKSLDIRSGATLIMAGLVAEGETVIDDAEIIDRGYAELVERLQAVGADIQRCE